MEKYKICIILNGIETDEYELGGIIPDDEAKELQVILYKKSLDVAVSNDLKS